MENVPVIKDSQEMIVQPEKELLVPQTLVQLTPPPLAVELLRAILQLLTSIVEKEVALQNTMDLIIVVMQLEDVVDFTKGLKMDIVIV